MFSNFEIVGTRDVGSIPTCPPLGERQANHKRTVKARKPRTGKVLAHIVALEGSCEPVWWSGREVL